MALGTWGLSGDAYGKVDAKDARAVIERALDIGVTLFDTADAYGGGAMERLLGEILPKDAPLVVVTKVGTDRTSDPPRKRFDADYVRAAAERSRKRLGRDRLDVLLLHNPSADAIAQGAATETLREMKRDGAVRAWGVSCGDVDVARAALEHGAEVIALAYNLVSSSDLHRIAGEIMVRRAGVLAHSVLGYGLLAGEWSKGREFPEGDHRRERWTRLELDRRIDQIESVKFLVRGEVPTLRSAALRFVLANGLVSSAVLGPRTATQLDDLVRETGMGPVYMRDDDLAQLPRALEHVGIGT